MKRMLFIATLLAFPFLGQAQIDEQPADKQANEAARRLYAYLKDEVWGKQVLSGCQAEWNYNTNDAERIKAASGKYPAVNIFDFQHFDQSWIDYRTDIARDWHEAGGIVGFMWHIHMPTNAFAEHEADWTAFYRWTDKPCYISPLRAATEGTLENRLFRRKLDGVAQLLLHYQQQGIPILWRPLHEGSGGWFWWGTEGAEAYKQLYVYMFRHFQQAGIHNLLWIWTSEVGDDDWYPGDEYVDIIARDGYPQNNTTHQSQAADFRKLRRAHPNKMTALPECNSVPSWEHMTADEAFWLLVAPWCGGTAFDNGNDAAFWQQFLGSSEGILSRDEVGKRD